MKTVYLDYNATTPVDPRVFEAMLPYLRGEFGNAGSRHHALGRRAAEAVERARAQVAGALGADPREIVFTSGATESNNLALKGTATWPSTRRRGRHIVTARTEHKAVLDPCASLEERGWEVTRLPVDGDGILELQRLSDAMRDDTVLVSLMHANNETGVLHPIEEVGRQCRERGVLFHTDATQSFGKEPLDVNATGVDLLSLSAHKVYGAKGVGALYVRRRPRVRCRPLLDGGGQERGLRSGTLNVPGIVSLGTAAEVARDEREAERRRVGELRDRLEHRLLEGTPELRVNGHRDRRLANTLNVSFRGLDAEALIDNLRDVAISSAAACTSAARRTSHVLGAMGLDDDAIRGSVRVSLGRFTTAADVAHAGSRLIEAAGDLLDRTASRACS